MRNIRLTIEYDGTNYIGWQRQDNGISIQGEIERVLLQIIQERVSVIGAGRTDAGVHARRQVANFLTNSELAADSIRGGLNGLLREDIVIHSTQEVPLEFNARHTARGRQYSYHILRERTAIERNFAWQVGYPLDLELMKRAAQHILGSHDFEAFCKANSDVQHHRCTVYTATWSENGPRLVFVIRADRFLYGMVRAIVGTMVDVGRGHITLDDFQGIMERRSRAEAGVAAPPKGLFLEEVYY